MTNLSYDALTEHIESGSDSGGDTVPDDYDANTSNGYTSSATLYTLSSASEADTFLTRFKRSNGYIDSTTNTKLHLGDQIKIQDGSYNATWYIAGFDKEHNQSAADGTLFDSGYGICLVPVTTLGNIQWNTSKTTSGGYISSNAHAQVNGANSGTVRNSLISILEDHLVERSVLLSSTVATSGYYVGYATAYTWATAYCTLMSVGQCTGTFASNKTKYDDGEANYKLPLFDKIGYSNSNGYWFRNVYDATRACFTTGDGTLASDGYTNYQLGSRPLIYIR